MNDLLALLLLRASDLHPDRDDCLVMGRTDRAVGSTVSEATVQERGE